MANTKQHIIHTAILLFNESGTGSVSTNHIAAAASISPGNLYYHYKNKSEIIRAILDEMYRKWNGVWRLGEEEPLDREHLRYRLVQNFELLWEYRFFYRESLALLQSDVELRLQHNRMMEMRLTEQETFVRRYMEAGVLSFQLGGSELKQLLTACWIIANNWLSFLEMNGRNVDEVGMNEGVQLIWAVMGPYLNDGKESDGE